MNQMGIYKILNKITGKYYIGGAKNVAKRFKKHLKDLRNEQHHCIYLQRAWNFYGEDSFEFIFVEKFLDDKALKLREQFYLDNYRNQLYNTSYCSDGGDILSTHPDRYNIIKKISNTTKNNIALLSEEERKNKFGQPGEQNGMYNKKHTIEARKKISNSRTGVESPFKGKKIEEIHGEIKAREIKNKISDFAKTRTGVDNPFYGKEHSQETKSKISEINKGKKPVNRRPVIIENVRYESVYDAAKELKVCCATIIHRIKSNNVKFKNYFYE